MIPIVSIIVALLVALALTFGRFARSDLWRATVTPLASIIGSGFLICGPLLAREFGAGAIVAMALLLAIAYAAGAVLRYNIVDVEDHSVTLGQPIRWGSSSAARNAMPSRSRLRDRGSSRFSEHPHQHHHRPHDNPRAPWGFWGVS